VDSDTATYVNSNAAVTVNLLADTASGGHAAGDQLNDIENLTGSAFGDTLTGNASANRLAGGAGDDTLDGGANADVLAGGLGADALIGGDGVDDADYRSATEGVGITLVSGGLEFGEGVGDTFNSVERFLMSDVRRPRDRAAPGPRSFSDSVGTTPSSPARWARSPSLS
jgi:Ca2+-binding RTX toxin-like protein